MNESRWFLRPLLMFIFSVLALTASLFLYIYWYVEASAGLRSMIEKFNIDPQQALASDAWLVILVVSILFGIILMGIFTIFVYSQKTLQLYRLQHNFINNFTHELKTPVTSIRLYLETFSRYDIARPEQLRYIGYMLADVNRLSDNINRILNLARIESRSYSGEFILTDLVEAVEKFFAENRHHFPDAVIRIQKPGHPIRHRINPGLLDMLLMNLATNSVKYNHSETVRIDIGFEIQRRARLLRFRDNGIGIEKGEIRRIFKKFYQSGSSDDMSARGTGLGLYLVQNIARLHHGRVIALSEGRGKGTEFTLVLPCRGEPRPRGIGTI